MIQIGYCILTFTIGKYKSPKICFALQLHKEEIILHSDNDDVPLSLIDNIYDNPGTNCVIESKLYLDRGLISDQIPNFIIGGGAPYIEIDNIGLSKVFIPAIIRAGDVSYSTIKIQLQKYHNKIFLSSRIQVCSFVELFKTELSVESNIMSIRAAVYRNIIHWINKL